MCDVCENPDEFETPEVGATRAARWVGEIDQVVLAGLQREDGVVEYAVYVTYKDTDEIDGASIGVMGDTLMRVYGGEDYSEGFQGFVDNAKRG